VSDVNDDQTGADLIPPPLGSSQGLSFDQWWEQSGSVYAAAVEAAGGQCWTQDLEERRALWERRYQRLDPPSLPTIKDIKSYQKTNAVEVVVVDVLAVDEIPAAAEIEGRVGVLEINGVVYHVPTVELVCDDLSA
jgi:hypothetical protein